MGSLFKRGIIIDIAIAFLVAVVTFFIAIIIDISESLHELTVGLEAWEVDELILVLLVFSLSLAALNIKRWRAEHMMMLLLQKQKIMMASLLDLNSALELAHDFRAIIEAVSSEVRKVTPYKQSWIYVQGADPEKFHLLASSQQLKAGKLILEECPTLTITGDLMLEEIFTTMSPVVVNDARTDPRTNKDIVSSLGNRTIINIPLVMIDSFIGSLGVGSFADEGVLPPTEDDMEYLQAMSKQVAVAVDRVRIDNLRQDAEDKVLLLSEAIQQIGDSVIITDSNGTIKYVNSSFTRISGYSSDEVIGKKPSLLKSGQQEESFYDQLWQQIRQGEIWRDEIINKRKDGTLYPSLMTVSPLRQNGEEITHFIATHSDLSDYHALKEQLCQAQKMEVVGTMLGSMSHDFNNTLYIIMGKVQLAQMEDVGSSELIELLQHVEVLTENAAEMVRHVLDFARTKPLHMSAVDITELVHATVNLAGSAVSKDIVLSVQAGSLPLLGHVDAILLQQAIINLLMNASDALESKPSPKIKAAVKVVEEGDDFYKRYPEQVKKPFLCLSVTDNGEGISEENIKNIFSAFFTTKAVGKGTGLGLSMVYNMVQTHKGFIEVDSQLNQGTTFNIFLPQAMSLE